MGAIKFAQRSYPMASKAFKSAELKKWGHRVSPGAAAGSIKPMLSNCSRKWLHWYGSPSDIRYSLPIRSQTQLLLGGLGELNETNRGRMANSAALSGL